MTCPISIRALLPTKFAHAHKSGTDGSMHVHESISPTALEESYLAWNIVPILGLRARPETS